MGRLWGQGDVAAAFSLRENLRRLRMPRRDAVPVATGLRALSMTWVLVQHVHQGLRPLGATPEGARFLAHPALTVGWAGNLGIEIFFVLSGYLIGGILAREREETGAIATRPFYVRRAMRILPAYLLAMAVNLALPTTANKGAVWANLLFVNNFVPFTEQFMAHCWSLAIEEQFFLTAPLLVLLLYRVSPQRRTTLLAVVVAVACVTALVVVFALRLELSLRSPNAHEFWRYMNAFYVKPHTRFGSIVMGILVAWLEREGRVLRALERVRPLPWLLAVASLAAMAFVVFVFPEGRDEAGGRRLVGSVSLALGGYLFGAATATLLLVSRARGPVATLLERTLGARVLHPVAQLSYAMYLLHPVCITPLFGWLGFDLARPFVSYGRIVAASFGASAAVAVLVFLLLELPVMRLRPRGPSRDERDEHAERKTASDHDAA